MAVTPEEEREHVLALQYMRDHPMFREVIKICLEYIGEELNEIREAAGLRPKARVKMVRAAIDHGKHNFIKRKKDVPGSGRTQRGDHS